MGEALTGIPACLEGGLPEKRNAPMKGQRVSIPKSPFLGPVPQSADLRQGGAFANPETSIHVSRAAMAFGSEYTSGQKMRQTVRRSICSSVICLLVSQLVSRQVTRTIGAARRRQYSRTTLRPTASCSGQQILAKTSQSHKQALARQTRPRSGRTAAGAALTHPEFVLCVASECHL